MNVECRMMKKNWIDNSPNSQNSPIKKGSRYDSPRTI